MTDTLITADAPKEKEAGRDRQRHSALGAALALLVALGVGMSPDSAHASSPGDAAVTYCVAGGTVAGALTFFTTFSVTATIWAATVGCFMAGGQEALAETMK